MDLGKPTVQTDRKFGFTLPKVWVSCFVVALGNAVLTRAILADFYLDSSVLKLMLSTVVFLGSLLTIVLFFNRWQKNEDPFHFFFFGIMACLLFSLGSSIVIALKPLYFNYDTMSAYGFWYTAATTFTLHYAKGLVMISAVTLLLVWNPWPTKFASRFRN